MDQVLTLIADPATAGLSQKLVEKADAALTAHGASATKIDWLAPDIACDITFSASAVNGLGDDIRQALGGAPIDFAIQPREGRRKALLIADMDSTIVTSETLDDLAETLRRPDHLVGVVGVDVELQHVPGRDDEQRSAERCEAPAQPRGVE